MVAVDTLAVTPEMIRDLVGRAVLGRLQPGEAQLLGLIQGPALNAYRRRWPARRPVLELVLQGVRPSTAAQGICDESTARAWTRHFWTAAAASLVHLAERQARETQDRDILRSLCLFLHPGTMGGGRISVRANMCPGCTAKG